MLLVGMILKISWRECTKKTPPTKKTLSKKKKLKIGVKLKKNLDKNKFGLVKKSRITQKKKSIYLVDKKSVEWQRKNRTLPNTIIHLRYNIPHTQHIITKRDVVQKTTSPPTNLFYTLTEQKCI